MNIFKGYKQLLRNCLLPPYNSEYVKSSGYRLSIPGTPKEASTCVAASALQLESAMYVNVTIYVEIL